MSSTSKGPSSTRRALACINSDPGGMKTRSKSTPRTFRNERRRTSLSPHRGTLALGQNHTKSPAKKLEFGSPPDPTGKLLNTPSKNHGLQKDQSIGIGLLAIVARTVGCMFFFVLSVVYPIITFFMSRRAIQFMIVNGSSLKGKASLFLFCAVFGINCVRNGLNGIQAETKFAR